MLCEERLLPGSAPHPLRRWEGNTGQGRDRRAQSPPPRLPAGEGVRGPDTGAPPRSAGTPLTSRHVLSGGEQQGLGQGQGQGQGGAEPEQRGHGGARQGGRRSLCRAERRGRAGGGPSVGGYRWGRGPERTEPEESEHRLEEKEKP